MELTGTLEFPAKKIVVIYGSNQQGKTNVINAIRYTFLQEVKGRWGRTKSEYDDRRLPSRDELIFGDQANIAVAFNHDNTRYTLRRSIQSKGRREISELFRTDAPKQKLDVERFLRTRLKVSLLDALFAPEIAQGFKQLYSGDIDEAVALMFKEITTLRALADGFILRLHRLKSASEGQRALMETEYADFSNGLLKTSPSLATLKGFQELQKFEAGKIFQKLDSFHSEAQKVVGKLKEDRLANDVEDAIGKARLLSGIREGLDERESILQKVGEIKDVRHDRRMLTPWIRSASGIKNLGTKLRSVPRLSDGRLLAKSNELASDFKEADRMNRQAKELAKKENVQIDEIPQLLKELSRLAGLLSTRAKVGRELSASVTKVSGKAYTVLPLSLLQKDPSFGEISRHPIPKGNREEKARYLKSLKGRIKRLRTIQSLRDESDERFEIFVQGIPRLNHSLDGLGLKEERIEKDIKGWSDDLANAASSFIGKKIKAKDITTVDSASSYAKSIETTTASAESRYLTRINDSLRDLSMKVVVFEPKELTRIHAQISAQRKELPQIEKVERKIGEKKLEWHGRDATYNDYLQVPRIVDGTIEVLEKILSKCFDEAMLRERITGTYNEIIAIMQERRLIQATAEIQPKELRSVVKYKGKTISHPAGSEKSFFSLAILTALAHYFQTPVLIDEVANNLDTKNLKAFFELADEFKDRYGIQYVLSIKQTNDFELDGWVRELSNELAIHEIRDKQIRKLEI